MEKVGRYCEYKERKKVPLNEKAFFAERAELNAEEEEKKAFEEEEKEGEPDVFPREFYNNELLAITLDYLSLLKGGRVAQVAP